MADTDKEVQQEGAQPDEAMAGIDESAAVPESDAPQKSKPDGAADRKPTGNMEFLAGETLEILANRKLIARGEVVVVNEKYGIRLTEIISPSERIARLK